MAIKMQQRVMLTVLEMLIRLISDSQIELERVLTERAKTTIKSAAFAAKWVCAIKNLGIKKVQQNGLGLQRLDCAK